MLQMFSRKLLALTLTAAAISTGCVSPVDVSVDVPSRDFTPLMEKTSGTAVIVEMPKDAREFSKADNTVHPERHTISSHTPNPEATKARIFARSQEAMSCAALASVAGCEKGATSYSGLAENYLLENGTAADYVKLATERGLEDAGFRVVPEGGSLPKNGIKLKPSVTRFWYWVDYSGENRYAHAEIKTIYQATQNGQTKKFTVHDHLTMKVPGFASPMIPTIGNALREYSRTIAEKIRQNLNK